MANYTNLSRYEIAEASARLAGRNRVVVMTIVGTNILKDGYEASFLALGGDPHRTSRTSRRSR